MQPFSQHKHELHDKTRIKIRKGTEDPRIGAKGLDGQRLSRFRSKITKSNDQLGQGCRHEIELQTSSKSCIKLKVFEKEQVSAIDKISRFRQNKNNSRLSNQLVSDAEDERKLRKVLKKMAKIEDGFRKATSLAFCRKSCASKGPGPSQRLGSSGRLRSCHLKDHRRPGFVAYPWPEKNHHIRSFDGRSVG